MHTSARILLSFFILFFVAIQAHDVTNVTYCEDYNHLTCDKENKGDCIVQQQCQSGGPETRTHCFTLWEVNSITGETKVQMKGCFFNNKDCYDKTHCVQKNKDGVNQLVFCCCNGHMCNQNASYERMLERNNKIVVIEVAENVFLRTEQQLYSLILAVCVFIFIITISFISWYYRHRKLEYDIDLEQGECGDKQRVSPSHSEDDSQPDSPTELLERRAVGRFGGAVWKGRRADEIVAVKIVPLRDQQSWQTELEVLRLPQINHENVLSLFDAYKRGHSLDAEFWLLTAFQEKGSLCDYLAANSLTWDEMLQIALDIVGGLNHLHQEISASSDSDYKPAVAHRDFKSKNVLLNGNMRACIADFGLALIFQTPDGTCGNQHDRVGTIRYMAPELLDGAIYFNKKSFLAIDMYACALVLWELISRCVIKEESVNNYKLPFEKEVGLQPTLEDMYECVSTKKYRPSISETWRRHWGISTICETIEECWDHDADARLSASCVLDRLTSLKKDKL